jgi:hypothetical protein
MVGGRSLVAFIDINNLIWMKFLLNLNILTRMARVATISTIWSAVAHHLGGKWIQNLVIIFLLTDGMVCII